MSNLLPIPDGPVGVVVAHPDDESFGLGALLAAFAAEGRTVSVLCFTHGEASTIGARADLGELRRRELEDAAAALGVARVTLLDLADGTLATRPEAELEQHVHAWVDAGAGAVGAFAALCTFEPSGVTGHPDHRAAARAACRVADARGLPVVEWGVDPASARRLHEEHGMCFHALPDGGGVVDLDLDREAQMRAIRCHRSQLDADPVVLRRLAVQGSRERVRVRHPFGRYGNGA